MSKSTKPKVTRKLPLQILALCFIVFLSCSKQTNSQKLNIIEKKPPTQGAVANIFGTVIYDKDFASNMKIFEKRLELYEAQKGELEGRVRQRVFEILASKAKMPVEAFLKKQEDVAKKKVSKRKIIAFLEGKIQDHKNPPEHIQVQVRNIIHLKNVVARYTRKHPIEFYLARPRATEISFNESNVASWGNKNAPITIVEFSDFECPYCALANKQIVAKLKKHYGKKKIRILFKHFPLSMHPRAKPASEASMCIHDQNPKKFWTFHDLLFQNQRKLGDEDLKKYAKKVGVNMKKFEDCYSQKKFAKVVQNDFNEGLKIGVNSTPSFFVNSQPVKGARDVEKFVTIIDAELKMKKMKR